ncbi:MAG: putative septum site-determining protein MinC [Desulfotomaculum sp. 46_296]|nr:MAG: putative septum site-determining protein MinC [Desulfotomaculum sp. 46_296]
MSKELITIKGTRGGLVILLDPASKFEELKDDLEKKFISSKGFFKGAKFTFHYPSSSSDNPQYIELENICLQHGLVPNKEIQLPVLPSAPVIENTTDDTDEPARLIFATIRSGQEIEAISNLIIVGDVNPGARLYSGGSIVIFGRCFGSVNAGVPGRNKSTITALLLNPVHLSIAGIGGLQNGRHSKVPVTASLKNNRIVFEPAAKYLNF